MGNEQNTRPPGAGKSSFELMDTERLFQELRISRGMTFIDFGCGKGAYSIAMSHRVGNDGLVYAVDLWDEGIAMVQDRIDTEGYTNIKAIVADLGGRIPIEDQCADAGLMSTVLHELMETASESAALAEAARLLKPEALLAIVEFKKIDGPPGPPKDVRLSPEELERLVTPHGFTGNSLIDLGPYHYLRTFVRDTRASQ